MNNTTRRRFLTLGTTAAVGGLALTSIPGTRATSTVTMDGLSLTRDGVELSVSGSGGLTVTT